MSNSTTCEAPYCRKMVRPDYEYAPFCFHHKDYTAQRKSATGSSYEDRIVAESIKNPIPAGGVGQVFFTSSVILSSYDISPKDAYAISFSNREMQQKYGDLTIPDNSHKINMDEYAESLINNGIEKDRISVIQYQGYNVYNEMSDNLVNKFVYGPNVTKQVVVLDRGTKEEIVVDPAISSLAICRNRSIPIENDAKLFPSGVTPFGDSPWIGKDSEYRNGAYMYWDRREDDHELNQKKNQEFLD